jgi:hypothetical protein
MKPLEGQNAGALGAWEPSLFHHRARRARVWSSEETDLPSVFMAFHP